MTSVGIICAYFGKLPGSYAAWLRSCEFNPTINFLLITDQQTNKTPVNVRVINLLFSDVQRLTDEKIGQHVALDTPYKLCDLKPLYGIIFGQYLKEYDYWGHCDMDMVFGDLRSYLNKYHFECYDKFLDLGHLNLYRNTSENNVRFKEDGSLCGDWIDVISDPNGHAFDERDGIYQIYKKHGYPVFDKRIYADIGTIHKRFVRGKGDVNYDYQIFYWEKGKVFRDYWFNGERFTEEFIYIHFQKRDLAAPSFDPEMVSAFYIGPSGFHIKDGVSTLSDIDKYNHFYGTDFEKREMRAFNRKDIINRVKRRMKKGIVRKNSHGKR